MIKNILKKNKNLLIYSVILFSTVSLIHHFYKKDFSPKQRTSTILKLKNKDGQLGKSNTTLKVEDKK
jgi:hypothetical protein